MKYFAVLLFVLLAIAAANAQSSGDLNETLAPVINLLKKVLETVVKLLKELLQPVIEQLKNILNRGSS